MRIGHVFVVAILCISAGKVRAQSTFTEVVNIFQTNCTFGCHFGPPGAGNLNLAGSPEDVYNALVNVVPDNDSAAAKGMLLVDPGFPENSFLMKKMIHGLDHSDTLRAGEGDIMPTVYGLPKYKIELVRQWILYGCPDTGQVVDYQLIQNYYNGPGIPRITKPAPPAPGEGFQVHFGPIFIPPATEKEFNKKLRVPNNDTTIEITRIVPKFNAWSHHLILNKYLDTAATYYPNGPREVTMLNAADSSGFFSFVTVWQSEVAHVLPPGTAYRWPKGVVLDMDYHVPNYSQDSILAIDAYLNFYTEPPGTAAKEMFTALVTYHPEDLSQLVIPNNGKDTTFVINQFDPDSAGVVYDIWQIQGHTHNHGVDYDIYLRNPDGSKGDQIYEGYFNQDYTLNQGYFDHEHPPVRRFEPQLSVNLGQGLIHEATYRNTGPDTVSYGLTTQDEMFITFFQYTLGTPKAPEVHAIDTSFFNPHGDFVGIDEANTGLDIKMYPNPTTGAFTIDLGKQLNGNITVTNTLGQQVYNTAFQQSSQLPVDVPLETGIYFVTLETDQGRVVRKLVVE